MPDFLHLSDLHFQDGNANQNEIIESLFKDIDMLKSNRKIEFVVFSGDLVQSGSEKNFNDFNNQFAKILMEKLGLPMHRLFIVPGNHDINIQMIDEANVPYQQKEELAQQKFMLEKFIDENTIEKKFEHIIDGQGTNIEKFLLDRFKNFNQFKKKLYEDMDVNSDETKDINPLYSIHKLKIGSYYVGIACFNSCFSCFGEKSKDSIGRLYFPMSQINRAVKKLEDVKVKIAMFHHPIHWFRAWVNSDSEKIERELIENFDFIMYGHVHEDETSSKSEEGNHACFCQGGYLSLRDKNHSTYSIVSFNDPVSTKIEGEIEFREYQQNKFDIKTSAYNNGKKTFCLEKFDGTITVTHKKPLKIDQLLSPDIFFSRARKSMASEKTTQKTNGNYLYDYSNKVYTNQSISNVNFSSVNFSGANFSGTQFKLCHFSDINLNNADFKGCVFKDVDFTHVDSFFSVSYSTQLNLLCAGGTGVLAFFSHKNNKISKTVTLKRDFQKALSIAWNDSGELLAMTSSDGSVSIWDSDKLSDPLGMKKYDSSPIYSVAWSPNGKYIAITYKKISIRILALKETAGKYELEHITTLNTADNISAHTKQILTLSWSLDGKWLVSAGIDKLINIWNVEDINNCYHVRKFTQSHYDYIRKIIWSKNSKYFLSCSDDGYIKFWGITNDQDLSFCEITEICILPGEDNNDILSMALNPSSDENILAVGLRDDQVALIKYSEDFSDIDIFFKEKIHKGRIWDICWDSEGKFLFTVGNEGKMKMCQYKDNLLDIDNSMEYEIKITCSNMQIHGAKGLEVYGYQVTENKDMPDKNRNGTLGDFLTSKGAIGYEKI